MRAEDPYPAHSHVEDLFDLQQPPIGRWLYSVELVLETCKAVDAPAALEHARLPKEEEAIEAGTGLDPADV